MYYSNCSVDLLRADVISRVLEPKSLESIQELLKQIPKESRVEPKKAEKGMDKEEYAALDKMSNLAWVLYPFKKTVIYFINKITGKNIKAY